MKLKRLLASALCAAMLLSAMPAMPASAAAFFPLPFVDIDDPAVAEAAELLRLFGIMQGDSVGHLSPGDPLTRAQFCKMAVELRGEGALAAAYERYTYFTDVKGDHWARGYINYASRIVIGGTERLVSGVGDGSFQPDRAITQAEAATMILRLLDYTQADVGMGGLHWYDGYMATAQALGLLEGLTVDGDAPLDRGSAAVLFRNLLYATPKAGGETFFTTLGGKLTEEMILLSVDATAQDGSTGAVMVRQADLVSVYKTDHTPFDASLVGGKVTLLLNGAGNILDMKPSTRGTVRQITLAAHEVNYITTAQGTRLAMDPTTPIYQGEDQTTYGAVYMDLRAGTELTFAYTAAGKLEYIYMPEGEDPGVREPAVRIPCIYEDAYPSPQAPLTLTVLGGATLTVLPQAVEELAAFRPGDAMTLFLTAEGEVAGVTLPDNDLHSTLVGVVTDGDAETATVKPVAALRDAAGGELTFTGQVSASAEKLVGKLVLLSSNRSGYLTLKTVSDNGAPGDLDVGQRTLNGVLLSDRVALYERTQGSSPQRISWSQITVSTIPAEQIAYVGTNLNGDIDTVILSDVTGDGYIYGYMSSSVKEVALEPLNPGDPWTYYNTYYITVENSTGKHELRTLFTSTIRSTPAGMAQAANGRVGETVDLAVLAVVPRSAFDMEEMTVTVSGVTYPISQTVECYNRTAKRWLGSGAEALSTARAYARTLTLYYDKAPEQGGKIRLVVVG